MAELFLHYFHMLQLGIDGEAQRGGGGQTSQGHGERGQTEKKDRGADKTLSFKVQEC